MSEIKVGDRVTASLRPGVGVVMAADNGWAWVRWPEEPCPLTQNTTSLTLITPKIAQPGMGEVVWDFYEPAGKRIPWRHSSEKGWTAYYDGLWLLRDWSDFSDDVTLAVDPKAGA